MTQMMKLVRVKAVAVFSVLSLVAAFLASGVVASTAAQAAEQELTTFKFKSGQFQEQVFIMGNWETTVVGPIVGGGVSNGTGQLLVDFDTGSVVEFAVSEAKAKSDILTLKLRTDPTGNLNGSSWNNYTGTLPSNMSTLRIRLVDVKIEGSPAPAPTPSPSAKKPRAPKALKVAGKAKAKSFRVSWTKPSTKGKRPVTGYRVIVKAQGAKKAAVNKKLGKKARSYKVSRKVLLKSLRSMTRGEGSVRFQVRLSALNGNSQSVYSKRSFWVTP